MHGVLTCTMSRTDRQTTQKYNEKLAVVTPECAYINSTRLLLTAHVLNPSV